MLFCKGAGVMLPPTKNKKHPVGCKNAKPNKKTHPISDVHTIITKYPSETNPGGAYNIRSI